MSRTGKIARLPLKIRDELCCRLQDGEPGVDLVAWLNGLPEVQAILAAQFQGRLINEPNLTDWKQGGYCDWLRHQDARDFARRLAERSEELNDDLADESGCRSVGNQLALVLGVELSQVAEILLAETKEPVERWKILKDLLHQLGKLRREDHRLARLEIERERWDREYERQIEKEHEEMMEKGRKRSVSLILETVFRESKANMFGGGEAGRKIADLIRAMKFDLPLPEFGDRAESEPSDAPRIKPD